MIEADDEGGLPPPRSAPHAGLSRAAIIEEAAKAHSGGAALAALIGEDGDSDAA